MRYLSIVVPTYNEERSIEEHYHRCIRQIQQIKRVLGREFLYEYLVIDNCSTDRTVDVCKQLRQHDQCISVYVNERDYGPVLSPFYGLMVAKGEICFLLAADLQEPPELLSEMVALLDDDVDAVVGCKGKSDDDSFLMWKMRGVYYRVLKEILRVDIVDRYSGFGLYRKSLIEEISKKCGKEPSLRIWVPRLTKGLRCVSYIHNSRLKGKSSYGLYSYAREAAKTIVRHAETGPKITAKAAVYIFLLSILQILIFGALKAAGISVSLGLAVVCSLILATLSLNMLVLGLIYDRIELIASRMQYDSREELHQSEIVTSDIEL